MLRPETGRSGSAARPRSKSATRAAATLVFTRARRCASSRSTRISGARVQLCNFAFAAELASERSSRSFVRYKQDFWLYETDAHIWDPNGILTWLASELDLAEKSGQRAWISASSCFRYLLTAAPSLARRSWTHVVRQDGHDAGPVELRESDLPPLSQDDRSAVLRTQVRNCCLRCRPHSSLCRHTVTRMSLRYRTLTTRTVAPIPRPASLLSRAR